MSAELESGVRTVVHLAEYFAELKQNAEVLADSIDAVGRGFLSAGEDEQVQALPVTRKPPVVVRLTSGPMMTTKNATSSKQ